MLAAAHGEAGALHDLGTDAADVFLRDLVNKLVVIASVATARETLATGVLTHALVLTHLLLFEDSRAAVTGVLIASYFA